MQKKVNTLIARAKANIEEAMTSRHLNHDPSWPEHHLLCNCNKCMKHEFNYIKEMRKEQRLAKLKAKQKVSN